MVTLFHYKPNGPWSHPIVFIKTEVIYLFKRAFIVFFLHLPPKISEKSMTCPESQADIMPPSKWHLSVEQLLFTSKLEVYSGGYSVSGKCILSIALIHMDGCQSLAKLS